MKIDEKQVRYVADLATKKKSAASPAT